MADLQNGLPPGWDRKLDPHSGKYYYINHYTRTTTWEDPRNRHVVLPSTPRQFGRVPVEHIPLQDMKPTTRSPLTLRGSKVQDSSFTATSSHSSTDTDDSVAKISAMFPTVSETHIKLLLKNCRYMKSIFTNADETLILECLQNCDNNIQKTSEKLKEMGYSKKETVTSPKVEPKVTVNGVERVESPKPPPAMPTIRTSEEKQQMKIKLQEQYNDVPEHLISIALESVNFDEPRANQILKIMKQEDSATENNNKNKKTEESTAEDDAVPSTSLYTSQLPVSQSRQSIKSLLKSEKKDDSNRFSRNVDQNDDYMSPNLSNTLGHNPELAKGPNDKLLLENYIQWQGSSKTILKGPQTLAKGSNKNLLSNKVYTPCGPNSDIRKGAKFGLAKGSIFTQLKSVVVGESRVK